MTDEERIEQLEKVVADYAIRYGVTSLAAEYFAAMSRDPETGPRGTSKNGDQD